MKKKTVKKPTKKCRPCVKSVRMAMTAPIVLECPDGAADGEWHVRLKKTNGVCSLKLVAV